MKLLSKLDIKSLRTKLIACFLAASVIPLAIVGLVAYRNTSQGTIQSASVVLQERATQTLDKVYRNLFERYGDVQAFAFNDKARGSADEVTAALDFYTTTYGCYDLMIVADSTGKIIAANSVDHAGNSLDTRPLIGRSVKGEAWYEHCMRGTVKQGQSYYSDAEFDKLVTEVLPSAGLTLNFSAPIFDNHGRPTRVWSNRARSNVRPPDSQRDAGRGQ